MITTRGAENAPAAQPQLPVALDTRGWVRVSKEQRQVILAELARSGDSETNMAQGSPAAMCLWTRLCNSNHSIWSIAT
jgi:hypothetical protein